MPECYLDKFGGRMDESRPNTDVPGTVEASGSLNRVLAVHDLHAERLHEIEAYRNANWW